MPIKVIIYDSNGVITPDKKFSADYVKHHPNISIKTMLPFFNGSLQKCVSGHKDLKQELEKVKKTWQWEKSIDELVDFWCKSESITDKDIINTIYDIRHKKGIPCFLATNQEKYRTQYMKTHMGYDKIFNKIYSSAHLLCQKPDLEFFKKVFDDINKIIKVKKNEILFFDDDKKNIHGAQKFGVIAKQYFNFKTYLQDLQEYSIL